MRSGRFCSLPDGKSQWQVLVETLNAEFWAIPFALRKDGGLVSNTPLQHVLDHRKDGDMTIFQVDLFSARGAMPRTMAAYGCIAASS